MPYRFQAAFIRGFSRFLAYFSQILTGLTGLTGFQHEVSEFARNFARGTTTSIATYSSSPVTSLLNAVTSFRPAPFRFVRSVVAPPSQNTRNSGSFRPVPAAPLPCYFCYCCYCFFDIHVWFYARFSRAPALPITKTRSGGIFVDTDAGQRDDRSATGREMKERRFPFLLS